MSEYLGIDEQQLAADPSLTETDKVRLMIGSWQAENHFSDAEAVAHLLLMLYRHTRIYQFMQHTGFDWDGADLELVGDSIHSISYILGLDPHDQEAAAGIVRFVEWRITELHQMAYHDYLKTPEWQDIRYFARRRAGGRCQTCNRDRQLQVHHRTYVRRGCESLDDVTVLCGPCHKAFHEARKVAR